jgi:hypothetical protein
MVFLVVIVSCTYRGDEVWKAVHVHAASMWAMKSDKYIGTRRGHQTLHLHKPGIRVSATHSATTKLSALSLLLFCQSAVAVLGVKVGLVVVPVPGQILIRFALAPVPVGAITIRNTSEG